MKSKICKGRQNRGRLLGIFLVVAPENCPKTLIGKLVMAVQENCPKIGSLKGKLSKLFANTFIGSRLYRKTVKKISTDFYRNILGLVWLVMTTKFAKIISKFYGMAVSFETSFGNFLVWLRIFI